MEMKGTSAQISRKTQNIEKLIPGAWNGPEWGELLPKFPEIPGT